MYYFLNENRLTEEHDFSARVKVVKSHDLEGIIDLILDRRNVISRTDLVAAFDIFFETVRGCISRGEGINLPLFNLGYSISGVFDDEDDLFDPARHRIKVNLNDGVIIKQAVKSIKPVKVEATHTDPEIRKFKDVATGKENEIITPKSIFEISGKRLKVTGDLANVGLFFVAEDGTEYNVVLLATNANKKLIGMAPQLDAGIYRIRVRTQYSNGVVLTKEAKETTSNFTIEVK